MHRTLQMPSPWDHQADVEVSGFKPDDQVDTPDEVRGRAALSLDAGAFSLHLRPTAAELRALAALCQQLADDTDTANVPPYSGRRAVWPAGCTHLPGVAA